MPYGDPGWDPPREDVLDLDRDAVRAHRADHGISGVRGPWGYLTGHFTALRAFYEQASRRGPYVVVWWD
ncbi:hypothetical protein OG937_16095 [Streptomyces sp. NBC_00510]